MKHKIILEFDDSGDSLSYGFRMGWLTSEAKGATCDLTCGAGVGSPWLIFTKKNTKTGKSKTLIADIRKIIPQLDAIANTDTTITKPKRTKP